MKATNVMIKKEILARTKQFLGYLARIDNDILKNSFNNYELFEWNVKVIQKNFTLGENFNLLELEDSFKFLINNLIFENLSGEGFSFTPIYLFIKENIKLIELLKRKLDDKE